MTAWAWEFLRRNRDYQSFWTQKWAPLFDTVDGCVAQDDKRLHPAMSEAQERFGILMGADPASNRPPAFNVLAVREIRKWGRQSDSTISLRDSEIAYVFDLAMPLDGQFDQAWRAAKITQKGWREKGKIKSKDPREKSDKYVLYLRILDGLHAGVSNSEISNVLFPNRTNEASDNQRKQTFKNHRDRARELRDTDYRYLAALAAAPSKRVK